MKNFAKRFEKHHTKEKASKAFVKFFTDLTKDRVFVHETVFICSCSKQETEFDTQVLFNGVKFIQNYLAEVGLGWWLMMMRHLQSFHCP